MVDFNLHSLHAFQVERILTFEIADAIRPRGQNTFKASRPAPKTIAE
jgi:hypothetical protein